MPLFILDRSKKRGRKESIGSIFMWDAIQHSGSIPDASIKGDNMVGGKISINCSNYPEVDHIEIEYNQEEQQIHLYIMGEGYVGHEHISLHDFIKILDIPVINFH